MEKVGVLVVCYGARETAMVDAFVRSRNYNVNLYIVDKQRNPFNIQRATEHIVAPDLNIHEICRFVEVNKGSIDFGIIGPEKPIIEGVRDLVEKETGIPLICPLKEYAIEESKVRQRLLFQEIAPEVNPRFKVFDPKNYTNATGVKKAVESWIDELQNQVVVKPDKPTAGKGVGVWGDHFSTRNELFEHFFSNFQYGPVIIEEKVEGEESSFQAFCDGKRLVALPDTRDHKRAFNDDKGPNTGGMGSYKGKGEVLPFLSKGDLQKELEIVRKIFGKWMSKAKDTSGLRGVPLYIAFMHTGNGLKILENNSRPGDPEITNVLPILKDDFVDVCFRILEGNLTRIDLEKQATVATYKVPPSYGGYDAAFPDLVRKSEVGMPVDFSEAYRLNKKYDENIRVYPAAMEQRDGKVYALRSRTVCVVGIDDELETARNISLDGMSAIRGGALWNRTDIASRVHIEKSVRHMEVLRHKQ